MKYGPPFIGELFGAVSRRNLRPDSPQRLRYRDEASGDYYERWFHRQSHEHSQDAAELHIDAGTLKAAVAEYLKQPALKHEFLDWYCADTLIYAEYFGTVERVEPFLKGLFSTALIRAGGGGAKMIGYGLRVASFVTKWVLWLIALVFVAEALEALGVLVMLAFTVGWQTFKWRRRSRVRALLGAMRTAYDVFQTTTLSWEIAWLELNRARELGAVWSGELYRLVETRRDARK